MSLNIEAALVTAMFISLIASTLAAVVYWSKLITAWAFGDPDDHGKVFRRAAAWALLAAVLLCVAVGFDQGGNKGNGKCAEQEAANGVDD